MKRHYLTIVTAMMLVGLAVAGCARPTPAPGPTAAGRSTPITPWTASPMVSRAATISTAPPAKTPVPVSTATLTVQPLFGDIVFQKSDGPFASSLWLLDSTSKSTLRLTGTDVVAQSAWFYDADHLLLDVSDSAHRLNMLDMRMRQSTNLVTNFISGWTSANGHRFVYYHEQNKVKSLTSVKLDGTGARRLTSQFTRPEDAFDPPAAIQHSTHDGKRVAFIGRRVEDNGILGGWGIYVADGENGSARRLVDVPREETLFGLEPALGHYLWWVQDGHLRVVSTSDGKVFFEEREGVADNDYKPCFSSTGMVLSFQSGKDGQVLLNMGTMKRTPLRTLGEWEEITITRVSPFSDDGLWLVFTASAGGKTKTWAIHTDSLKLIELGESDGDWFVWSPDGRYVAYKTWDDKRSPTRLRLAALYGDAIATREVSGNITDIVWSPTSRDVAFGISEDATYTLLMTGQPVVVAKCTVHYNCHVKNQITGLTWSPDGNRLMFVGMQDPGWGLYTVNADGSRIQKLIPTGVTAAIWRPRAQAN